MCVFLTTELYYFAGARLPNSFVINGVVHMQCQSESAKDALMMTNKRIAPRSFLYIPICMSK